MALPPSSPWLQPCLNPFLLVSPASPKKILHLCRCLNRLFQTCAYNLSYFPVMAKFIRTYKVKSLCGMKRWEKVRHCRLAFENSAYKTLINKDGVFTCQSKDVVSNFYSVSSITNPGMVSLRCPTWRWTTAYSFNLSAHLSEASLVAFIQINPFRELLPDAVIQL